MKTIKPFKITVILLLVLVLVILVAAVAARKWPTHFANQRAQQGNQAIQILPPVISLIKGVEVISALVDEKGFANITVINKTGKPIIGLSLSVGNMTFTDDNGISQDNPTVLIAPNHSYTLHESMENLQGHDAMRVSAVFYADSSEEGDDTVRKNVHEERERQREKRLKAKEKN
jgi:hypothetical protein